MHGLHSFLWLIAGTSSIFLTWLLLALGFIGLGLGVRRLLGLKAVNVQRCLMAFWTGFAVIILFLQLWNFLFPIQWPALALVMAGGAVGLATCRRELARWLGTVQWRARLPLIGTTALLVFWVANQAIGPADQYDSGLYHVQTVEWAEAYPVVPGLAHLHGRLAFNSASLLYAAMLDTGPWDGRAAHLANGLLTVAVLVQILVSASRLRNGPVTQRSVHFFTLLLLAPVIATALGEDLRSYTTDGSLAAILFAVAVQLYASVTQPDPDSREEAFSLWWLCLLLAVAVCVKLSAVAFAGVAGLLAVGCWLRESRRRRDWPRLNILWLVAVPALLAVSWLSRGIVLSGYPAYPIPSISVPVEWRIPHEQAVAERDWIAHAARYASTQLGIGWDWLLPWIQTRVLRLYGQVRVVLPLFVTLVALSVHAVLTMRRRESRSSSTGWLMLLPVGAGLIFWFLTAPSLRFAFPLLWLMAATCVVQTWQLHSSRGDSAARGALAVGLIIGALPLAFPFGRVLLREGLEPWPVLRRFSYTVVTRPGPDRGLHPMERSEIDTFITASGLTLNTPANGMLCWDAPIPCTPHPAPNLRLRRRGDLGSGFVSDGRWGALGWPNPWSNYREFTRCVGAAEASGTDQRACLDHVMEAEHVEQ